MLDMRRIREDLLPMSEDLLPILPTLLLVDVFRILEEIFRLLEEALRFLSLVLPVEEVVLLPSTGVLTRFLMEYLSDLEKLALTFLVKEMANPILNKPKIVIPPMVIHPRINPYLSRHSISGSRLQPVGLSPK